jgi:fibronectin type 3 domain-containing protein
MLPTLEPGTGPGRRIPSLALAALFLLNAGCEQVDVTAVPADRVEISPSNPVVGLNGNAQLHAAVLDSDNRPLSGRRISWSSEDEAVAAVDDNGLVTGLATGTTVISAQTEGATGTATVRVTAAPLTVLTPQTIQFTAVENGASPGDRTVNVTNGGEGTLTGLSTAVRYAAGQPTGWLSGSLAGTSAPTALTLSATPGSLPVGTYNATVDVASTTAGNSPGALPVTLEILAPAPAIGLSATTITFNGTVGGANPAQQNVAVTNVGAGTLDGLNASVTYASGQPTGWLTATLSSATAPSSLALSAATGSLAAGTYTAEVRIASSVAQNSPQTVAVTFVVGGAAPRISVSPSELEFSAQEGGGNPATRSVQITNTGGGSLAGLEISIIYPAGQPGGWVTASLDRTTAPATLTAGAVTGSLPAGTYTAAIRISAPDATNSPVLVDVTFVVGAAAPTPAAPSQLAAAAQSDRRIDLSWQDNSSDEAEFQIRRRQSGTDWTVIGDAGADHTTFTDSSGIVGSTTYEYAVRACNGSGCSAWSDVASTTTAPNAPTSAAAVTTSPLQISVTWQDNSSDETAFRIERSVDGGQNWIHLATAEADTESFTDTTVSSGDTYRYRISACRGSLCSVYSNEAQASTGSGTPATPTGFTGTAVSSTQIDLSWTAPGGQTHYELRRRDGGSGPWVFTVTIPGSATSYSNTGLIPGTRYEYELRACASSCSEYTDRVRIDTPPAGD